MSEQKIGVAVLAGLVLVALAVPRAQAQLEGAAGVIAAQGRFEIDWQRARLLQEQLRQERLKTHRQEIELWMWKRDHLPTPTDDLERARRDQVRQAQRNPPLTEILSGKSLNDLLQDCQILQGRGIAGPDVLLDEDLVRKVNVVRGGAGGNPGLLQARPLPWPLLLAGSQFREDRRRIETLLTQAVRQTDSSRVEVKTVEELLHALTALERNLAAVTRSAATEEMGPSEQIRATRFLGELRSAVRLLQEPDAAGLVAGRYTVCGRTVPELIRHMTQQGLRFAAAAGGNSASYVALHRALASYDTALQAATDVTFPDRSGTLRLGGR